MSDVGDTLLRLIEGSDFTPKAILASRESLIPLRKHRLYKSSGEMFKAGKFNGISVLFPPKDEGLSGFVLVPAENVFDIAGAKSQPLVEYRGDVFLLKYLVHYLEDRMGILEENLPPSGNYEQ